jgi:hypothetical protein
MDFPESPPSRCAIAPASWIASLSLKPQCCPKAPARKIPRSIHESAGYMARDIAKTEAYRTSRCQRKKVEMLLAHLKRTLKLDRLRGPNGARDEFHPRRHRTKPPQARQADPGANTALSDLRRRAAHEHHRDRRSPPPQYFKIDFFNGIAPKRSLRQADDCPLSAPKLPVERGSHLGKSSQISPRHERARICWKIPKPSSIGGIGNSVRFTGSRAACYALARNAAILPHRRYRSATVLRLSAWPSWLSMAPF